MKTIFAFLAASIAACATTTVGLQESPTATAAIMVITTNQALPCTVRASEGTTFGTIVNDVNPTLFPGSNSTARAGTILYPAIGATPPGTTAVKFLIGMDPGPNATQISASDNRAYSRPLHAATTHILGAT